MKLWQCCLCQRRKHVQSKCNFGSQVNWQCCHCQRRERLLPKCNFRSQINYLQIPDWHYPNKIMMLNVRLQNLHVYSRLEFLLSDLKYSKESLLLRNLFRTFYSEAYYILQSCDSHFLKYYYFYVHKECFNLV